MLKISSGGKFRLKRNVGKPWGGKDHICIIPLGIRLRRKKNKFDFAVARLQKSWKLNLIINTNIIREQS